MTPNDKSQKPAPTPRKDSQFIEFNRAIERIFELIDWVGAGLSILSIDR
jgi:hypothetical protein